MGKAKQPAQDKMLRPQENKASEADAVGIRRVRVRLLDLPPALRVMVLPSDKVIECDPALADILVEAGYAEMADDSTVK